MTVRRAAKNPLPRPWPVSIETIAGIARPTTSSKELGTAAMGLSAVAIGSSDANAGAIGVLLGALGALGAVSALGARDAPTAAVCDGGLTGITWRATNVPAAIKVTTPRTIHGSAFDFDPAAAGKTS